MTDFNATAEFVRRHAEKERDIIALGAELKEIGSIDQARTERQAALDKAIQQHAAKLADIAASEADHKAWMERRDKDIAGHLAAANDIVAGAKQGAADLTLKAEITAQNTINTANTEVERIQRGHVETLRSLNAELDRKRAELESMIRELEAARTDHAMLVQTMKEMRELAKAALAQ